MGFYGHLNNSNKASFTFDRTYPNRAMMDRNCESDSVFLGRYVLVEYDDPAISVYYNPTTKFFYSDQANTHKINPVEKGLYQDILTGNFFTYEGGVIKAATINNEKTPYAYNYNVDVNQYGRGYDSTVWIKRYDVDTNTYKYAMIAELNTVVPELHILVEPPQEATHVPYFDHDSTNIDYYLHLSGNYHDTVRKAETEEKSDERVTRLKNQWNYAANTNAESYSSQEETVNADIFYNKAGFDSDTRSYVEDMIDTINFEKTASGRRYSNGIFDQHGQTNVKDTREWYIQLPSIGNAICKMWDQLYSEARNKNLSTMRGDPNAIYTHEASIGVINSIRDLLGYTFKPLEDRQLELRKTITSEDKAIYYAPDANGVPATYYYYAHSPSFYKNPQGDYYYEDGEYKVANKIVTAQEDLYKLEDKWVLTQLDMPSEDSMYGMIFTLHKLIGTGDDDSRDLNTIIGSLNRIRDIIENIDTQLVPNRILWTTDEGVIQTSNTQFPSANNDSTRVLTGAGNWENRVKAIEVVEPSNSQTEWTTSTGTIDTNTNNNNTVKFKAGNKWIGLDVGTGNQQIEILHSKSAQEAHNFNDDVNIAEKLKDASNGEGAITLPVLETDNAGHVVGYTTNTFYIPNIFKYFKVLLEGTDVEDDSTAVSGIATADVLKDTLTFKAQNKWIDIAVDADNDTITIGHKHSNLTAHNFANDVYVDNDIDGSKETDCRFTIPILETDNAGHVINYGTKTIYIPYNYRNIILNSQSDKETAITTNHGTQEADATNDSFSFATGNQWIEARIDEDKITFAHALIDENATKNWEYKATATDDWQAAAADGNKLTIPTFEIDNAGHIVRNGSVNFFIPNNFRNISVVDGPAETASDVDATQTSATIEAESTVDTWSIAPQNKWLRIAADAGNDKITIGHSYSAQAARNFNDDVEISQSLKASSNGEDNKITLPVLETDNAGHVIGHTTNTLYIPNTFKFVKVLAADSDGDNDSSSVSDIVAADVLTDTLTFSAQNKWIDIAANPENDTITIGHKHSNETSPNDAGDAQNQTPQFGATFKVPNYEIDKAGHIVESSSHTVKIPQASYTETANKTAGIVTSISLNQNTGAFEATRVNVGTLALTEYSYNAANTNKITSTDSINTAFSKVDAQIAKEITERGNAITTITESLNAEISARESGDTNAINTAKSYTDAQIADLVNSAPETLNTLNELAAALGNDAEFSVNVAQSIGENTTKIGEVETDLNTHVSKKDNPHTVTKAQVGLGNVTNESKTTMFTSPTFTGTPVAPTASAGTNTTQIATTAFVTSAVGVETNNRNDAITQAVQNALNDLLQNYGIKLSDPEFSVSQVTNEASVTVKINITKYQDDEHTITLEKSGTIIPVTNPTTGVEITESGTYVCTVTRTHNAHQATVTRNIVITVPEVTP